MTEVISCLVLGCVNRSDQGLMAGSLCAPCDYMLRSGKPRFGSDWVSDLARNNNALAAKLEKIGNLIKMESM